MQRIVLIIIFFLIYIGTSQNTNGASETLGATDTIAAQAFHSFDGKENLMARSALMLNGFSFLDGNTTATYASSFWASGNIFFNGGRLFLGKDLILRNIVGLRSNGIIYGNDRAIEFPCTKKFSLGDCQCLGSFETVLANIDTQGNVISLDWSYDNQYVAVGTSSQAGTEIRIYEFDGSSLTLTASREISSDVDTLRWHPLEHFFATGYEANEVDIFKFDPNTNVLGRTDFRTFVATNNTVFAVHPESLDWDPKGIFLGVAVDHISGSLNESVVTIFGFDDSSGLLSYKAAFTLSQAEGETNPFSWSPSGTFIAYGFEGGAGLSAPGGATPTTEFGVRVLAYNGSGTLTLAGDATINADILSVDWHPTGSYLAVGVRNESGITETLRVYEYDMLNSTLTLTAVVGEADSVYEVHWSTEGNCLLASVDSDATTQVRNYYFDIDDPQLLLVDEYSPGFDTTALRWSPNNKYVAVGFSSLSNDLEIYGINDFGPFTFIDTHLCFNSDVTFSTTLRFEGNCSINGRGNLLDISPGFTMVLGAGAKLCMRDLYIRGAGTTRGQWLFSDNNAQIRLSNVDIELADNVTTTIGNIYVEGPSTWYLGQYDWTFSQLATLTVDGVTLWKDSLDFSQANAGTINIGATQQFYDSIKTGTIKCRVSLFDLDLSQTSILTSIPDLIDTPHINSDTILSSPVAEDFVSGPANSKTMLDNMYLAPQRKLRITTDSLISGSTHYLDFSQAQEPVLLIDAGVTLSLKDITLRNFTPSHVRYGDEESRLLFGANTTIELGQCSDLKALVNGVEQSITWTFQTDSSKAGVLIKGRGNRLTLPSDNPVSLFVDSFATLTLHHITIDGLGGEQVGPSLLGTMPYNMRILHPSSRIALKDTTLLLSANYSFTQGHLELLHDATLRGTYTFAYQSPQISHVRADATLLLDYGVTLSYDAIPGSAVGEDAKKKIVLDDESSVLHLRGATLHATHTGLQLETGTLRIEEASSLVSEAMVNAERVVLSETTMNIDILANAQLSMRGLIETR